MDKEIRAYCMYCKEAIYEGSAYTKGTDGKFYHPDCYNQINTYTDDFGTYTTNEFGEIIDE